jgi:hypothetical protein
VLRESAAEDVETGDVGGRVRRPGDDGLLASNVGDPYVLASDLTTGQ